MSFQAFAAWTKSDARRRARHLWEFILLHAIPAKIRISPVCLPGFTQIGRLDRHGGAVTVTLGIDSLVS